jgi:predicted nucleic acid-binding protein
MTLVMPEHALLEIANAIRYSSGADESDAVRALDLLADLRLEYAALGWELLRSAAEIAWNHQITVYDAAYVALAEALNLPLVTADEALVKRLAGRGGVKRLAAFDVL